MRSGRPVRTKTFNEHSVHPPQAAPTHLKELCSLQLLRGVAALGVIIVHAYYVSQDIIGPRKIPYFDIGFSGVDLFFIISGFHHVLYFRESSYANAGFLRSAH